MCGNASLTAVPVLLFRGEKKREACPRILSAKCLGYYQDMLAYFLWLLPEIASGFIQATYLDFQISRDVRLIKNNVRINYARIPKKKKKKTRFNAESARFSVSLSENRLPVTSAIHFRHPVS